MNFDLSAVFCVHNGVLILDENANGLVIGMLNPDMFELKKKIESRYKEFLKLYNPDGFSKGHDNITFEYKNISKDFFLKETARRFSKTQEVLNSNESISKNKDNLEYLIDDAPIIHLLNSLIMECIEKKGSDIHIEPANVLCNIKMRVLGNLELYSTVDSNTARALTLRILFLSGLDITENRRAQDGAFHFEIGTVKCEVRASIIPSENGYSTVLRLLGTKSSTLNFTSLHFAKKHREFLEEVCKKQHALFLICGATGAGKSTTLAAIIHQLTKQNRKIITIEDPIEYKIEGVVQISVNPDIDMDFSQVLKRTFRHDPDVIMVGEIRDENTAQTAVRAALTGHLVLASIHALDAPSAIIRLLDMGIENWLLASVFGGSMCQRLVKKQINTKAVYEPIAETLPSCNDISKLILNKAPLCDFRKWMGDNGRMSMEEEEMYAY